MDCGGKMIKVYLDDERQTPEGWTRILLWQRPLSY